MQRPDAVNEGNEHTNRIFDTSGNPADIWATVCLKGPSNEDPVIYNKFVVDGLMESQGIALPVSDGNPANPGPHMLYGLSVIVS